MTDMQKVDREWMHRNNQKLILKAVLEGKEISKAQIAARTGMSVVSVGRITDELIAMGLLRETGGEAVPGQKAGRPAKRLALPLERFATRGDTFYGVAYAGAALEILTLLNVLAVVYQR